MSVPRTTAEYLAERYGESEQLTFGLAGRSEAKLNKVLDELCEEHGEAVRDRFTVIVADVSDWGSVERMCSKACVVISTVGPFVRFGEPVIAGCCKYGVDYVDITGEIQWVKRMMNKYEDDAVRSHARIVSFGGVCSFPVDSTAWKAVEALKEMDVDPSSEQITLESFCALGASTPSGATLQSTFDALDSVSKISMDDTDYLLSPTHPPGPKQPARRSFPRWDPHLASCS